jgi:uncharacterized membrane protein
MNELIASLPEMSPSPSALHAATVHLPIALAVFGVPLVYLCAVLDKERNVLRSITVACYLLLAATGYAGAYTGEGARAEVPNTIPAEAAQVLEYHEFLAEKVWIIGLATAVLVALSMIRAKGLRPSLIGLAMLTSLVTMAWVAVAGHLGGTLVYQYGLGTPAVDYSAPLAIDAPDSDAAPTGNTPAYVPIKTIEPATAEQVSYSRDVAPILEEFCIECHGERRPKGGLEITSLSSLLEGGKKAGPAIVPGKPDESPLVKYIRGISQPSMPKGEPLLDADTVHTLRLWIAAGAHDDSALATN